MLGLFLSATVLPPAHAAPDGGARETQDIASRLAGNQAELQRIGDEIRRSQELSARLDKEIAALAADRDGIRQAMITAAAEQKRISVELAASSERLSALQGQEGTVKASLRERRGVLAEVLAALERMGRKPPPALLVKPDDALGSVRSAILLGAVVPEMREQTAKLVADLTRLSAIRKELEDERTTFAEAERRGVEEEARLERLLAEKQKLEADGRQRIGEENRRAAELAARATTLNDLIATLEAEATRAEAAEKERLRLAEAAEAERARQAEAAEKSAPDEAESRVAETPDAEKPAGAYDIAALRREMTKLEPAAPFSTLKKSLVRPVAGRQIRRFAEGDGIGRPSSGIVLAARSGDVVTAPAEGHVLYAGPFRSYGQLLILNAGDGYHIVLAGMSRIDVAVGQFVLAGEPLAAMGPLRVASAAEADVSNAEPSLYVEFRKDGKPVDPTPWWADGSSGRTRNDT
ncbi:peptidoglycan DD-metalloendopeptidase family protein [Aureimonas sp. ME7]|uniref:murein hydrolase activator EnvC family protein n=1 Tax=Aureimonas sp. ME7 TaxID=2744252 RepID=UPI0015F736AC|nr:peptidoglycan DD-metalloendopeptidase family protein [Aureimonas sp. ME7]